MLNSPRPSPGGESDPDDETLARAAIGGDVRSYEAIYRRHAPRLYAVVWRLCGGHDASAEDALQDAFVKAWRALPGFRFQSALGTWLHRLAVTTALMQLRVRRDIDPWPADTEADSVLASMAADAPGCAAAGLDLERALATLPPRARAVLVLHDIEGWTHPEVAGELAMAVGSSKAQLHRARRLLRERLGERA